MDDVRIEKNKLPPVDGYFWLLLITATTLGETAGDLLSMTMKLGYALSSVILVSLFVIALIIQLATTKEHRGLFWTVIILTSTAGTTLCDYVTRSMGLGYTKGVLLLLVCLVAVFAAWKATTRSLAISSVRTVKSEALYWAAILISSTLGTALGDFLADDTGLNLGFGGGTLVLAILLMMITAAALFTRISRVLLFWLAIVVTHPIGATMGDYLTKPSALNFGPLQSTVGLAILFTIVAIAIGKRGSHQQNLV